MIKQTSLTWTTLLLTIAIGYIEQPSWAQYRGRDVVEDIPTDMIIPGEPYDLAGKRIVFTNWYYVHPGDLDWIDDEGKSVYVDGNEHPDASHFVGKEPPRGIHLRARKPVIKGPLDMPHRMIMQFLLNWGKVDGQTVLDKSLITAMGTPSTQNKFFGMGINLYPDNHGIWRLGHGGGGMGFTSGMTWLPEYGIGFVFLGNSHYSLQIKDILLKLINEKLVEKGESVDITFSESPADSPLDPNTFTPYKPAWKKYIGTYKYMMSGWKLDTAVRIALALGVTDEYTHVKIYEKDGYLYVDSGAYTGDFDGGRLDEYLPGLFFTPSGECLDLRGPKPTWQNFRIKKVGNDSDGDFDLSS